MHKVTTTAYALVVIFMLFTIVHLFTGCTTEDAFEASTGETPAEYADRLCHENMLDCEYTYQYETPADNKLGYVEMCTRADDLPLAETLYGAYKKSTDPRFDLAYALGIGPRCIWHCDGGPGCNAYGTGSGDSCFNCPVPDAPNP